MLPEDAQVSIFAAASRCRPPDRSRAVPRGSSRVRPSAARRRPPPSHPAIGPSRHAAPSGRAVVDGDRIAPPSRSHAIASRDPSASSASAVGATTSGGASIDPIDDPSPASQPSVERMTIWSPASPPTTAMTGPSADVAKQPAARRAVAGSRRSSCRRGSNPGRRASPTGDRDEVRPDPRRRRRDDRPTEVDVEGAAVRRIDERQDGRRHRGRRRAPRTGRLPGSQVGK